MIVAKAGRPKIDTYKDSTMRKPASLPEAKEGEKTEEYIFGIKQDAPFESCTLLGLSFHKNVFPSDASLTKNQDKHYNSHFLSFELTQNQVDSIRKRADETIKVIPPRPNPKFEPNKDIDEDNPEYLQKMEFPISDYLILEKASEYNPMTVEYVREKFEKLGEGELFKDELYKEQAKKKK